MKIHSILFLFLVIGCTERKLDELTRINNFTLLVPTNLKQVKAKKEYDELLSLSYERELKILIKDDVGKKLSIKDMKERKHMYQQSNSMPVMFNIKFDIGYKTYNGFTKGELSQDSINDFPYVKRTFKSKINEKLYYFDMMTINIGYYFYDVLITGEDDKRDAHKAKVDQLLKSIVKTSDN